MGEFDPVITKDYSSEHALACFSSSPLRPPLYSVVLETTMSSLSKEGPLLMPPMTKARRRKSDDGHVANTKPLRSSPLAGPALNRSPVVPVLTVSSIKPTDDSLSTPPICHVLNPKSSQNLDSSDSSSSTLTTPRQRGLGPITGRCKSLHIPSTSSSDSGQASPSLRPRASEWEIDPLQSLSISRTPVRSRPASGIASFRPPIAIVEEEPDSQVEELYAATDSSSKDNSRNSSTSEFTNSQSPSQHQVNSWYTSNTYDVTPRFSRLGLSSTTVVMPLSAKEHRRVSRRSTSLAKIKTTTTTNSSTTTSLPTKRFFMSSLSSNSSAITRAPLEPPPPIPSKTSSKRPPLSRTFSNTSSSETSSIASNSQCEIPTPISTSTSSPSLTRSRSSEDSISTWNESLPPTTPYLEPMPLPVENDAAEYKRAVDGEMRGVGAEFRGHRDRDCDHGKIVHYSDITITIKSASEDDETRPDQVLMRTELHPQSTLQQPAPQPTTSNPPFQTPAFPKDVKKERSSLRKKLTMTTIRLTSPITRATATEVGGKKISVGLPELPVPLALPSTLSALSVNDSEVTLPLTSSISLPISASKKKKSTLKGLFKNFIARW